MQPRKRQSKGMVSVISTHDRLQLRFHYGGRRYYLTLGLADTQVNRKVAEAKAKLIESDIIYERFDPTLEKYKPQNALSVANTAAPLPVPKTSLLDLWEKYTQFQQAHLEETTIIRDYGKIEKRIRKFPKPYLEDAIAIQAHLLSEFAAETAKRTLKQLSACCNWAIRKKLISENPFKELAQEVKTKKASKVSRKPFSKECVAAIISAFEHNTYCSKYSPISHSYYAPYVKFLFHTGCRPEEAIALKWKHVEKNQIYICEAVATDVRIRKTTKTDTPRYFPINFPINEELRAIFEAVRPEHPDPNSLVFPARRGKELDTHNFLNRVWKPVVEKLVEAGKVKEYLPQYNCRHTFITLCLESGIISRRVADWCGTSVAVIEEHYAGAIAHIQVPSFGLTDQTTLED
ncbi:Arm DNA-binding domain-containing protein [Thermocoleostomius sinensis]|uniref:DUF3596 domain-containing protein n=1 Tax=Thermocoleostomius sinensis A174 TaxID=2016057 RepID=A0A9E8ZMI5_9CYAN|nr:DUF3596 domain-containing protein [Thermocoleostomius sinensis]WAL61226.1 DUF3596 domain-containing protein [Thermocoleostomius sinensis A174]